MLKFITHPYPPLTKLLKLPLYLIVIYLSTVGLIAVYTSNDHSTAVVAPVGPAESPDEYTLWLDTNHERNKAGLPPLTLNPWLTQSSLSKCADMIQNNYWGHVSPSGKTPQDFIQEVISDGIKHHSSGENLSLGYNTSDAVTAAWMASPGHKANILYTDYKSVGFAICMNAQTQIIVVQQFLDE